MYDKDYITKVLRINGLSPDSSTDDLRSVLLYAKCSDVDNAIQAMRDNTARDGEDMCGLQRKQSSCNILLADKRLSPDVIRDLLGVDMTLSYDELEKARVQRRSVSLWQVSIIAFGAILCAAVGLWGLMWYNQIDVLFLMR